MAGRQAVLASLIFIGPDHYRRRGSYWLDAIYPGLSHFGTEEAIVRLLVPVSFGHSRVRSPPASLSTSPLLFSSVSSLPIPVALCHRIDLYSFSPASLSFSYTKLCPIFTTTLSLVICHPFCVLRIEAKFEAYPSLCHSRLIRPYVPRVRLFTRLVRARGCLCARARWLDGVRFFVTRARL